MVDCVRILTPSTCKSLDIGFGYWLWILALDIGFGRRELLDCARNIPGFQFQQGYLRANLLLIASYY